MEHIWEIYMEYIRDTHKYLLYEIIRNQEHGPNGTAAKPMVEMGTTEMEAPRKHWSEATFTLEEIAKHNKDFVGETQKWVK